jgi:hypothetical protein
VTRTDSSIIEALDTGAGGKPTRFRIRVIKAGLSGNRNFYPDAALREAAPLFDGARVFIKSDADHLAGRGKDVRTQRDSTCGDGTRRPSHPQRGWPVAARPGNATSIAFLHPRPFL